MAYGQIKASSLAAGSTLGTVPASKQWIVFGFQVANASNVLQALTLQAGGKHMVGADTPLPAGSAIDPLAGKLLLNAGESITEAGSANDGDIDYLISYMIVDLA